MTTPDLPHDRDACLALDRADPLAHLREQFDLPDNMIYLDGNSLGPRPRQVLAVAERVLRQEWGHDLIRSWNTAGWFDLPQRLGDKLARLVGAGSGEVVVTDSTSINLFKVLAAALRLQPQRRVIVSERDNFPTDLYIAQGLSQLLAQGHELRLIDDPDQLDAAIDGDTAVVMLTHVNYRTGRMHDMASVSARAHAAGALMLWDLAHSAGAVPVALNADGADFAVGCTYKYLNGGPGSPAFLYVAPHLQDRFQQPLSGWWGHEAPFAFTPHYEPAQGIRRYLCGTQPIVSLALAEPGLDIALSADMSEVRAKSVAMTQAFIQMVEQRCAGHGLSLASPRDAGLRGSQVSFVHEHGYEVMQALIARGVVGDYREPGIMRFGFTPLYLRHVDVWDAVTILHDILSTRAWDLPEFRRRSAVT